MLLKRAKNFTISLTDGASCLCTRVLAPVPGNLERRKSSVTRDRCLNIISRPRIEPFLVKDKQEMRSR